MFKGEITPRRSLLVASASLLAVGCAGDAGDQVASTPPPEDALRMCNAEPAQYHVGHDATESMGAVILKDSGARTLRWGPPRSAWTMDYRQDRVNVRYDDAMKIIDVTCG